MPIVFKGFKRSVGKLFTSPVFLAVATGVTILGVYAYKKQGSQPSIPASYTDQVASQYPTYAAGIDPYELKIAQLQAGVDQASIASQIAIAKIENTSHDDENSQQQIDAINNLPSTSTPSPSYTPPTPPPPPAYVYTPTPPTYVYKPPTPPTYTVSIPSNLANYAQVKKQMEATTGYKFYVDPNTGKLSTTATQASLNKILATSPYKAYYKGV